MNTWRGRVTILACDLALALFVWIVLVEPLLVALDSLEEAHSKAAILAERQQVLARRAPIAATRLAGAIAMLKSDEGWLPAGPVAQLAAMLQQRGKTAIERNGGSVRSLLVVGPAAKDGMTRIAVRVDGLVPQGGLVDVIRDIEIVRSPLLQIDNLDIRGPSGQPGSNLAPNVEQRLIVRFDLVAYQITPP